MTHTRSLTRRRRALILAPLALGGLAVAASPAVAGISGPPPAPVAMPNLSIEKLAGKGVGPGELAHWTIRVTNVGAVDDKGDAIDGAPVAVEDVIVRDEQAMKGPLAPIDSPKDGILRPGQHLLYSVSTPVTREMCDTGAENTATVELDAKSGLTETDLEDNSATAWAPVYCSVDVALDKTSERDTYAPGETIGYVITITNVGDYDVNLADMRVSDPDLPGLTLVLDKDEDGKEPVSFAPGESVRYVGSRVLGDDECGVVSNTATVVLEGDDKKKDGPVDADLEDNTDTHTVTVAGGVCAPKPPVVPPVVPPAVPRVTPPAAPVVAGARTAAPAAVAPPAARPKAVCPRVTLRTRIAGPRGMQAGERATYRITVANTGKNRARKASVRVVVPSGMAVVGRAPKGARVTGGALVWNLGAISGFGERTVRVTLQADADSAGRHSARAFASAQCAARSARAHTVRVAAVRAVAQPAVTG